MAATRAHGAYARRRPERTALYEVVRDNLETLYGAIDDGALDVRVGSAACSVEASRGYAAGSARRVESSRSLARDAGSVRRKLLGQMSRIFVSTVQAFYGGKTGAMTVVQRTSSDLRLNPHLHVVFLDGSYQGGTSPDDELVWRERGHLQTREVGRVLEKALRRMHRWLRRRDALQRADEDDESDAAEANLAASAVSGQAPPAGPQWGLPPLDPRALEYDKPQCASLDGFTLHAATRAGAMDDAGREALLRYVLRPPVAQERITQKPDGLVRITLKRAYTDGTIAVEMDPLSLLCRLATSVPPPRFHTVKYAGVLAPASRWRSRIAPPKDAALAAPAANENANDDDKPRRRGYRPWAELLKRTFAVDVLACPPP